jgi:hypothetical protein
MLQVAIIEGNDRVELVVKNLHSPYELMNNPPKRPILVEGKLMKEAESSVPYVV